MASREVLSRRVMCFDLSVHGHHPAYIQHLIQYWQRHSLPGRLLIVVSPQFLQYHADVVALAGEGETGVEFVAIAPEIASQLCSRKNAWQRLRRTFQEWQVFCHYATQLQATQALLMYFDTAQLPLAFWKSSPCPVSGIYFRPTFHYPTFPHHQASKHDRLQQIWEQFLLKRVLSKSSFKTLFSLDPFVVKLIEAWRSPAKIVALPDPVQLRPVNDLQTQKLKRKLGLEPQRQVFLLFGALNGRKGIYPLLEAAQQLPPELAKKCCLLLVGQANDQDQKRILAGIDALKASPMQVIHQFEFVSEAEVPCYFQLADVVLAPYQRHVGMSGILLQAAAAGKPVLSSNYGLMGEMVRRYRLGLTVDSTQVGDLLQGWVQCLSADGIGCDRDQAQEFATQNSAERFAQVIFDQLLPA